MKIYTKAGDSGYSYLYGGQRVPKNHARLEAYGTVDELNASIGIILSFQPATLLQEKLSRIQNELFDLGADLATPLDGKHPVDRISEKHVHVLEEDIDALELELESLKTFILPGGSKASSFLHLARTICRRAERASCAATQEEPLNTTALIYLNRLSDLLFVMARYQNKVQKISDIPWQKK
ncbi:cob(I)yrinic acid a,c-diamide adenosyltransferase [Balneolaceae bacterium ANBcel3]|nr:cob(I)yrinic acid a,c-diamide adenosyltransferase [Balneolaceae bacterium ANBcel3]